MRHINADVAIVGAGPAGLTAAHAVIAAAPHLKVVVFERSPADLRTTRRGAGLGLDVNGQKALKAIKPELHASMMAMATFLTTNKVLRPDGSEVCEVPQLTSLREQYAQQGFRTPCLFGWSEMQRLLADALPDSVPIHLGMQFDRYEDSPDGSHVTVFFEPTANSDSNATNSSLQPVAVQAKLLVGCDGYFNDKLSEMGLDPAAIQQQLSSGSAKVQGSSAPEQTNGYCAQEVAAGEAAKARCLQAMTGVAPAVLQLIDVTPPSALVEHGVFIRPAATLNAASFGAGRVVILGDGAHPLRPTGQGNNQAVEDAHGLGVAAAAAAAAAGDIDLGALQTWREARARRVRPIVAFSTATGRGAYSVAREAASEEEAAVLSMFPGTPEMSNQAFERYLFEQEFEPLSDLRSGAGA